MFTAGVRWVLAQGWALSSPEPQPCVGRTFKPTLQMGTARPRSCVTCLMAWPSGSRVLKGDSVVSFPQGCRGAV